MRTEKGFLWTNKRKIPLNLQFGFDFSYLIGVIERISSKSKSIHFSTNPSIAA